MSQLLDALAPYVGRICGAIALDAGEDAAQETLLSVFRRLRSLHDPDSLHAWVRTIAVREAIRAARPPGGGRATGGEGPVSSPLPAPAAGWPHAPPALRSRPADRVTFGALLAFTVILVLAPQLVFPSLQPLRPALVAALVAVTTYLLPRLALLRPLTVHAPEVRLAGLLGA